MSRSSPPAGETFDQKVARVLSEPIEIVLYDARWQSLFAEERDRLIALPGNLIRRIEHVGSTAVPGLAAKPVVDVLVEVTDLEAVRAHIVPILEARGYDYFSRPASEQDARQYAWFIGRDPVTRRRTHHVHMMERDFPGWDALIFRDVLIAHGDIAQQYQQLKLQLASRFSGDREAYTQGKTEFILRVTHDAKRVAEKA